MVIQINRNLFQKVDSKIFGWLCLKMSVAFLGHRGLKNWLQELMEETRFLHTDTNPEKLEVT